MLFLPIIFACTISSATVESTCMFKALPSVSSPQYCMQIVEEVKQRLIPHLDEFKFIAVSCVSIEKANEV